ncbi:MAG: ABC transporter permease [Propionibacteriaceae bacterium]|nr:ABC transporter permease [Propionibacteriaceae bacterium]
MARVKLSFFRMIRAEWIKIFTVRSTGWILLLCILISIGLSAAFAASLQYSEVMLRRSSESSDLDPGAFGPLVVHVVMACGLFGQLFFMILSILMITNEYSTGTVRSTFTVAPRRIRVLISKMLVLVVICVVTFAISVVASWAVGYLILQNCVLTDLTLISYTNLRIAGGFLAKMVLVSLFCFGLGAMIRSTAGSIGTSVAILWVLPIIAATVASMISGAGEPVGWREWIVKIGEFLPTNAGDLIIQENPSSRVFLPWGGTAALGGWAFGSIILAFIATARRRIQ